MKLGICVASKIDDIDYVVEAERLGFTHAWFADSQMIWSDAYATAALAADRTSTIKIGTGVSVAATRPAPVTAASMATINQIAPGRTFCGIGTGNTAMRIMGHKPMTIAQFDQYLTELKPLLAGEEAMVEWRGKTSPVRHIMPDAGFVNFEDPIPMYVSGFGPKSLALAGKHGDGLVLSVPPDPALAEGLWRGVERGAAEAGRQVDRMTFPATTLNTIVVLDPGRGNRLRSGAALMRGIRNCQFALQLRPMAQLWPVTSQPSGARGVGRLHRCARAGSRSDPSPTSSRGAQLLGSSRRRAIRDQGVDRVFVSCRNRGRDRGTTARP